MKRSAAITELENQLQNMIGSNGGLLETRWVGKFVELMKETANTEGRDYLLKVLFNTPQTEKAALSRFIQLGGVEILGTWISEHRDSIEQEDIQIVHSCLSCLNKITISTELLDKTQIGKIVNKLAKHSDPSIQAKANTIVSKWKKMVSEQEDSKKPQKPKKETKIVVPKKTKPPEVYEPSDSRIEEVYIPLTPPDSIEIMPNNDFTENTSSTKKIVRWADQDYLEKSKFFWRGDEPNAKCATLRPIENQQDEDTPRAISVEDFRKREIQMERELNRKEKEKDGQVRVLLENMTPRISYTAPIRKTNLGIRVNSARVREKYESMEARDQYRREQQMAKVIYQRESEIPKSPLETHSKSNTSPKDIVTIPFFKPGSYPPKVIRITEPTNLITEDFMKVFRPDLRQPPPPPPPLMNMYGQVMSHQVPPPMPGPVPSMYTGQSIPQAPPRVGPLPSAPIPAYNTMMPGMPMYDPNMMVNPMDPYNFMNKGKILYNPVTKKPQNYRTVPCRRFHSADGCERGDNCHFIHDFQYQGRAIPNFQAWKNNNMQKSMQMHGYPTMPGYYPPPGPEGYDGRS